MEADKPQRCGCIAIVGRPNVGKSTLLNHILSTKVSITSHRPQTTRHQVQGILTQEDTQFIFVDTPGIHKGRGKAINRYMNKTAKGALEGVDVILFVIEANKWLPEDQNVLEIIQRHSAPVICCVNKVDILNDRTKLFATLDDCQRRHDFADIFPLCARKKNHVEQLLELIAKKLPEGPWMYSSDTVTDRGFGFRATEIIREKIMRIVGDELPYEITISLEKVDNAPKVCTIHAIVWVERDGQKAIVIGSKGARMKKIGEQSRVELERMLEKTVFLRLWVKVKSGWSDDESALSALGYNDE